MSSSAVKGHNNKRIITTEKGYLLPVDLVQNAIYTGEAYMLSHIYAIAAGTSAYFLLESSNTDIILQTTVTSDGAALYRTYLNPTVTTFGAYEKGMNRNTGYPSNDSIRAYYAPSLTVDSVVRKATLLSTGAKAGAASASVATLLKKTDMLVYKIDNISNGTINVSMNTDLITII